MTQRTINSTSRIKIGDDTFTVSNHFTEGARLVSETTGQGAFYTYEQLTEAGAVYVVQAFTFAQPVLVGGREGIAVGLTPSNITVMFRNDSARGADYFSGSTETFTLSSGKVEPFPF